MPDRPIFSRLIQRTRRLSTPVRYVTTLVIVLAFFAIPEALVAGAPASQPFSHLFLAVLIAAALFDHGTGLFATLLSAAIGYWYYMPPGATPMQRPDELVAWALFIVVGSIIAMVIEALHRSLAHLQEAHGELRRSERTRALLLREFRHRTRNDLGSLVGLLMLRARMAPSAAGREALRDAADHALALARVHARLALDEGLDRGAERPMVDSREFVSGLCADIESAMTSGGLRPVRLQAQAEAHPLSAERAVPLGLVLNETLTNAMKYAFPEGRSGCVKVNFARDGNEFVLLVADDGIGLPPEGEVENAPPAATPQDAGLGTRLLRALAAQLRGRFARRPGPDGRGTVVELRFAATEPGGVTASGTI